MTSAAEFLREFQARGLKIELRGENLRIRGKKSELTPELKTQIASRKRELMEHLKELASQPISVASADSSGQVPLAYAQEQLLVIERIAPCGGAYNIMLALRLQGDLDVELLRRAQGMLVERHESLRTTFSEKEGEFRQRVHASMDVGIPVLEIEGSQSDLEDLIQEHVQRPFDLSAGPLMRSTLFRQSESDHIFAMVIHHLVIDGWSLGVLRSELFELYDALYCDRAHRLPDLSFKYTDFVLWQRRNSCGSSFDASIAYWKEALAGAKGLINLPLDRSRPALPSYQGSIVPVTIAGAVLKKFIEQCKSERASLFMGALAAFKFVLSRHTGEEDVVVGTPIALRKQSGSETLVGNTINTIALRTSFADSPTARELVAQVRDNTLCAFDHAEVPFERLVQELSPVRDSSYNPIYQVLFNFDQPERVNEVAGLSVSRHLVDPGRAQLDLSISLYETEDGVRGQLTYNSDIFDHESCSRFVGHFERAVAGFASDIDRPLTEIQVLSESEEHQLLEEWNQTAAEYPEQCCIHELIQEAVRSYPERTALTSPCDGDQPECTLSYAELNTRANQLAHRLVAEGVAPGDLVALCLERSPSMLIGMLGILKAGAAYVPLDPHFPIERLSYMFSDCGASVLVSSVSLVGELKLQAQTLVQLDISHGESTQQSGQDLNLEIPSESLAYVIYTSGSTGKPKGVELSHRGVVNFLHAMAKVPGLESHDCLLAVTTLSFDIAVLELLLPLTVGAQVILAHSHEVLDGARLIELTEQYAVSAMQATPATWRLMLEAGWSGSETLKVLCGGEALPVELANQLSERCSSLWNMYGPTETTIWSTVARIEQHATRIPIGRPIANTTVYILDAQMRPVPLGATGELYIGGDGLARGYLDQAQLTDERFINNPFGEEPGSLLYRTGDLARYWRDGQIECLGRIDSQLKLRGFRIELGEIEAVLEHHHGVEQAVVVAWGRTAEEKRLVAYVKSAQELAPSDLRQHVQTQIPDYMVPCAYMMLEEFPLTPNGKVDRGGLPDPDLDTSIEADATQPRNDTERRLADIWCRLLGLGRVGVHANFFTMGGHSLLAVRLTSRVQEEFAVDLSLRNIFMSPVLAAQALEIESGFGASPPKTEEPTELAENLDFSPGATVRESEEPQRQSHPQHAFIEKIDRSAPVALSFAQEPLIVIEQVSPNGGAYNIMSALRLQGALKIDALRKAQRALIARHESLRTTFSEGDGEFVQVIHEALDVKLPVVEIGQERSTLNGLILEVVQEPFDLSAGPLFRSTVFRFSESDHVLVFVVHHTVADGWSLGIIRRELFELYEAFSCARPPALPALPIQYADFAAWQRNNAQGHALDQSLSYWERKLDGIRGVMGLPLDRQRPAKPSYRGGCVSIGFSPETSREFVEVCRGEGASLFMGGLTAFGIVLHRHSGEDDLVIGTPIAMRTRRETEGLIGNTINTIALRNSFAEKPAVREMMARVRGTVLDAFDHAEVPFERIVQRLSPVRDPSHNPIYQVIVNVDPPDEGVDVSDFVVSNHLVEPGRAQLDLSLTLSERPEGIQAVLTYNSDIFDRSTAALLMHHFKCVVDGFVCGLDQSIDSISLLTTEERSSFRMEAESELANFGELKPLHTLFHMQANLRPDAAALSFGGEVMSYGALAKRVSQLANHLRGLGVGRDVLVPILAERSFEMVVGVLAILEAGGAYVPIDARYPESRIAFIVEDCAAEVILVHDAVREGLPELSSRIVRLDGGAWESESDVREASGTRSEDLAYVIYTSGSTGKPKGVLITHANASRLFCSTEAWFGFDHSDVWTVFHSFAFDFSVWEMFGALTKGGKLVIVSYEDSRSPERYYRLLVDEQVTVLNQTPSAFRQLDAVEEKAGADPRLCLRYIIFGGEALELSSLKEWVGRHGASCPQLINMYGITETTVHVTYRPILEGEIEEGGGSVIGCPLPDLHLLILDKQMDHAPTGIPGEMYVGGAGVARGYLNRPELTAERFIPNPFDGGAGSRLYRTGDLARRLPSGDLEYMGRIDNQVKIRGHRIELGEIESTLEEQSEVSQAVVTTWGEGQAQRLVAYVISGSAIEPETLRARLRETLPEYMVPFAYVAIESIPLTPNGKLDRKALPEPDLDVAVGQVGADLGPRNRVEVALAEVWCDLLELSSIGIHSDFFDVGGHSLLGLRMISEINKRCDVNLRPADFFEHPTIAGLASLVSPSQNNAADTNASQSASEMAASNGQERAEQGSEAPADFAAVRQALAQARLKPKTESDRPYRMRESWVAKKILATLYSIKRESVRTFLHRLIHKLEGGDAYSITLRKLFKKHYQIEVGDYAMGAFSAWQVKRNTKIGRYSLISDTCRFETANHPGNTFSSHAVFYNPSLQFSTGFEIPRHKIEIGNDVFIGHNATILFPTQKIGDGAIIAAHAVVSQDVPPFAVVAGYPAEIVRYRFSPEVIASLLEMRWWDASLEDLEPVRDEFWRPIEAKRVR